MTDVESETVLSLRHTAVKPLFTPPGSICSEPEDLDEPGFPLVPSSKRPVVVLDADEKTPDGWIPRDPRLIRLTGVHPFNVEAPLTDLFNEGFLTSPELFYVRNHGPVPQAIEADVLEWELTVEGMVEHPLKLTIKDLLTQYDQVTYPVTLVCAGNRRKEQNVVRKTNGFSWGPAGVSTALWTGVAMLDILKRAKPLKGARYVCMEGADKLPNGYYGTSVKLNWVMDSNRGIMLAYRMNGEPLTPDHGKPLRAIIPGQIGGRSVKWLTKLIITKTPSDNWYHIYDNRVLPTSVSPEEAANNKSWWTDERYAIYDLNSNSAIAFPAHEERLNLVSAAENYKVRGYAYGGGGRRITRCEVTLDKGKTWRLANIDYAEDQFREAGERMLFGGKLDMEFRESSFCWCFWDIEISIEELKGAHDIFVRCMDESMNVQPRDMYWSVLGMMNNPWYRVTISNENDYLRFEHPVQPALMQGGWMERVKKAGGDLTNGFWGGSKDGSSANGPLPVTTDEAKMTSDSIKRVVSTEELQAHSTDLEPWFVVDGEVYDGTPFLQGHPGGATSITSAAGQDSTDEFMAIHSETAKAMMPGYHIGRLSASAIATLSVSTTQPEPDLSPTFLSQKVWKPAVLKRKVALSHNVCVYTFALSSPSQRLGLPCGNHVMLRLPGPAGRPIVRAYTPISTGADLGKVDVLVKIYAIPASGRLGMAQLLDKLEEGERVEIKGPVGKFTYLGHGACSVSGVERTVKNFVMVCGGSGITPIYQVFKAVMTKDSDVRCIVLDGNRGANDILLGEDMEKMATESGGRGKVVHSLSAASDEWTGLRGRIGRQLLRTYAGKEVVCTDGIGEDEVMILICGPAGLEKSVRNELEEMGWKSDNLVLF